MNSDRHPSVLLCDGERQSGRALNVVLRAAGLRVCAVQTADDALTRAALQVPDLAIIEVELVESSGTEVCRRLREWSSMPLIARVEALLRRATTHDEPVIVCGQIRVDLAAHAVRREGREIRLTPTEYKLLSTLARNRGRLLTHDALLRQAWGAAHAEDRQTLRAHMANLRRKLAAPSSSGPIRTYPGVGYLLEDDASRTSAERPAAATSTDPYLLRAA